MSGNYYKVYLYGSVNTPSGKYDEPIEIMDNSKRDMVLLNTRVSLAVNEAGSFEFTMPRNHIFYDTIVPFGSTIAVTEDDDIIFIGRPLPPSIDFWGQKTYHCEGALAFLNDVVLYHKEVPYNPITATDYFNLTLSYYNKMVGRDDRQFFFNFSSDTFDSIEIYDADPWDFQTVLEFIRDYLHQFVSGYFYVNYIDFYEMEITWISDLMNTPFSDQPIQYAVNMIDIAQDGGEIYTAAIAKGGENSNGKTIYMTKPYISKQLLSTFGFVCKKLEYPDAKVVSALNAYCKAFLENRQFKGTMIEVSAADQHPLSSAYSQYRLFQKVDVNATQIGVSVVLPITRLEINLASAVKKVVAGQIERRELVISTSKNIAETGKKVENKIKKKSQKRNKSTSNNIITSSDGNDYAIDVNTDPITGEMSVVATKVPSEIRFTRSVIAYVKGDHFNIEKYTVTAFYGDGGNFDVTDSCAYNIENGTVIDEYTEDTLIATYMDLEASTPIVIISGGTGNHIVIECSVSFSGEIKDMIGAEAELYNGTYSYSLEIFYNDVVDFKIAPCPSPSDSNNNCSGNVLYCTGSSLKSAKMTDSYSVNRNAEHAQGGLTQNFSNLNAIYGYLFNISVQGRHPQWSGISSGLVPHFTYVIAVPEGSRVFCPISVSYSHFSGSGSKVYRYTLNTYATYKIDTVVEE